MPTIHISETNENLTIIIRPRCPKCKKEFMLNLKNYLPGKHHACYACGTVTQFDASLAEKAQRQIRDLETSTHEILERYWSE